MISAKQIDEYTKAFTHGDLTATVRTSDQYATVYRGDKPAGTLTRRRHYEPGPEWIVYKTDGTKVAENNMILPLMRRLRHA